VKARRLIETSSFGPDVLNAMYQGFDRAWHDIEGNYGGDRAREAARLKLANAVLAAASAGLRDPQAIAGAALQTMASNR
jgi:hypothetical protein